MRYNYAKEYGCKIAIIFNPHWLAYPFKKIPMRSFFKAFTACFLLLTISGCASVILDSDQQIYLATYDQNGSKVKGASCKLSNDVRQSTLDSLDQVKVRRSYSDLMIECKKPGYPDANGRAVSRTNAAMYGNILTVGIGAIFDHAIGSAYTYPQHIDMVFGQSLDFDRRHDQGRQPSPATEMTKTTNTAAVMASASAPAKVAPAIAAQKLVQTPVAAASGVPGKTTTPIQASQAMPLNNDALKASRSAALTALAKWRMAWVSMNPQAYFELYAKNYTSSATWKAARKARLLAAEKITIDISEIKVNIRDARHLSISFHQEYRSPSFKDTLEKILYWEEFDGTWLIVNESIIDPSNPAHIIEQNAKL
jgi:hypothetical protein